MDGSHSSLASLVVCCSIRWRCTVASFTRGGKSPEVRVYERLRKRSLRRRDFLVSLAPHDKYFEDWLHGRHVGYVEGVKDALKELRGSTSQ